MTSPRWNAACRIGPVLAAVAVSGCAQPAPHDPAVILWYKTNVAVSQADLDGICLLPAADFTFLKDVHRRGGQPQVH